MANHKSAEKRARQSIKRRLRNKHYLTQMRNSIREIDQLIEKEQTKDLSDKLSSLASTIHRMVHKGMVHQNMAARTLSRLSRKAHLLLNKI